MNMNRDVERGLVQVQIVNYVNWKSTVECIQSVKEQTYEEYRVVVIENASPNDSIEQLRKSEPDLVVIASDRNVGWGAGLNLGFFDHPFDTDPEFFLTVNSDAVLEPSCLSKLVTTMKTDPNCAVVSPAIYNDRSSDRTNNMGFNLAYKYLIPLDLRKLVGNHRRWRVQGTRQVSWVSDTVALMRRSAIYRVGGYDARYFMYGQMTDMGYRLKQLDYTLTVDCDAVAYHAGRGSSGGGLSGFSLYYKIRNWIIFQRKHFGRAHLPYVLFWSVVAMSWYSLRAIAQGKPHFIVNMSQGVVDGFAHHLDNQPSEDEV
jgi:GT2 family glycosyltransferase